MRAVNAPLVTTVLKAPNTSNLLLAQWVPTVLLEFILLVQQALLVNTYMVFRLTTALQVQLVHLVLQALLHLPLVARVITVLQELLIQVTHALLAHLAVTCLVRLIHLSVYHAHLATTVLKVQLLQLQCL
jgi:hypothetical protein